MMNMNHPASSQWLTPPKLAERWGVTPDKIITWIRSGELRAVDLATRRGGRPRWRIPPDAIEAFERARTVQPQQPRPRRRRPSDGIVEFF